MEGRWQTNKNWHQCKNTTRRQKTCAAETASPLDIRGAKSGLFQRRMDDPAKMLRLETPLFLQYRLGRCSRASPPRPVMAHHVAIWCDVVFAESAYHSAVALAFEEMRSPYASGREICVQKFEIRTNEKRLREMNERFSSTFATITPFSEILKGCSQTVRVFLSQYSRVFRDRLPRV